jgi:hypothetical protein
MKKMRGTFALLNNETSTFANKSYLEAAGLLLLARSLSDLP